jgi:hypothetical protein
MTTELLRHNARRKNESFGVVVDGVDLSKWFVQIQFFVKKVVFPSLFG